MGAGDVKLAAALGCLAGLAGTAAAHVRYRNWQEARWPWSSIVASGRIAETLRKHVMGGGISRRSTDCRHTPRLILITPAPVRMPYGLAFAAGTIVLGCFYTVLEVMHGYPTTWFRSSSRPGDFAGITSVFYMRITRTQAASRPKDEARRGGGGCLASQALPLPLKT